MRFPPKPEPDSLNPTLGFPCLGRSQKPVRPAKPPKVAAEPTKAARGFLTWRFIGLLQAAFKVYGLGVVISGVISRVTCSALYMDL